MPINGVQASAGKKPGTPTVGTATAGNAQATVAFTAPSYIGKGGTVTYVATSNPGNITGSSTSSPITVTGLTNGTAYTFTTIAQTSYGVNSDSSSASNSITPVLPIPSVGSWSVSTPMPTGRNATMGQGNGTWVVSAGGNTASVFALATSYYWSGSAWTDTFMGSARSYTTMAATNDGKFYALGGYNNGGSPYSSIEYKTAGNQPWATGTSMPNTDAEGAAAGLGSGVLYVSNSLAATRFLPSYNGAWTSGTTSPVANNQGGTHSSDWSKAFIPRGGEVTLYSITSYNGSWTQETNMPATYTSGSLLNSNQNCIWMSGGNFNSNTYRYFNNTWTAQTAAPVYFAVGRAGGIRANIWSLFANRQNGVDYSSNHYTATIS